jgi:hypothetical protein
MSASKTNPLWDKFILWSLTPESKRGSVTSEAAWAREHDVSDRTLRRWKEHPEFAARRVALAADVSGEVAVEVVDVGEVSSVDEGDYRVVKQKLIEGAKSGNAKALDLYFRTYGKPFVEEEVASRSASLADADLEVLVAESILVLGEELLADRLRAAGWTVSR